MTMKYWKEQVEKWEYTDEEWNSLALWRYVDYTKWIPLKDCTYTNK